MDAKKRGRFKTFRLADVKDDGVFASREDLFYDPPEWMRKGYTETATGYGARLNSGYTIYFEKVHRRVYVTQFSNNGTLWFKYRGRKITVWGY